MTGLNDAKNHESFANLVNILSQSAKKQMKHHNVYMWWDCYFYNGGTVLVLLFTSLATFLPSTGEWFWVPRVLTGLASAWIAIDRALAFGPRWKFHMDMKNYYDILIDELDMLPSIASESRDKRLNSIRITLAKLRRQEAGVPGIGIERSSNDNSK